jgi:hypothetical protein
MRTSKKYGHCNSVPKLRDISESIKKTLNQLFKETQTTDASGQFYKLRLFKPPCKTGDRQRLFFFIAMVSVLAQ